MANKLYQQMNGQNQNNNFFSELQNFIRANQGINPREEVMKRIKNGIINQNQINEVMEQANRIAQTMNMRF